ncbi:EPIDERMAL PATTERNING FACTOR-like protein 2 [Prosopis cineraria]|uniref:EPIDERMAL PATTERNING FACTOR-like protein 2 n=1 Tax=Prosopis cineraria TaxID=364024 RepID=UPI00240F07B8|nr:EPIDERMAL PATTERNING FACTOR-like protein 2 [Prosopis cineraria]XP_054793616.1 EPIDERMAL PATTERNING FACTOR-like protein 2 [Prosopis cineraria]
MAFSFSEKMVSDQICVCWHKYIRVIICLLTLLASTSIFAQKGFMAEGRAIPRLTEASKRGIEEEKGLVKESKAQIGSRPPRCEGRCTSCGHCEAVQIPIIPQVQSHSSTATAIHSATRATTHSRGDDLSNYKPMSWKCKCGNYFFNP